MIKILSVWWILDSPYSGFTAGDQIDVFWDTTTDALVVKKNDVVITTGADIPFNAWNYNGLPHTSYKQELQYKASICDDTTLVTFSRVSIFPYLEYNLLADHLSCVVPNPDVPLVCDIQFTTLPTSTPTSTSTALDGTIVAVATSSHGAVKYKLNEDFIDGYSDPSAQSSGTFTGLGFGVYQVFARDEVQCLVVQTVEVLIDTSGSYEARYKLEFYNPAGHHIKTEILEKDYAGSVEEIKGFTQSSCILSTRGEGEIDKFIPVITSQVLFSVVSETNNQFVTLYTNDQEKYRLRVSIDTGAGYDIKWLGKVLINQYEEDYISTPYSVKIIAIDGLTELKDIPFSDATGGQLRGSYSCIKLISWILAKIGIERNIRVGINMYAAEMDSTDADDPLDQAYVDVLRYYLLKATPSCMEVLKIILESYGAQIIHYDDVWNIVRVEEKVNSYDYREFDENGVYVSNSSYDPVKNIKISSEQNVLHWAFQNQNMIVQPGFGSLQLLYDMGKKKNLFLNGDFAVKKYSYFGWGPVSNDVTGAIQFGFSQYEGTIADTTGFEVVTNGNTVERTTETIENENVSLGFQVSAAGSYLQSEILLLRQGNTDTLRTEYVFRIANIYQGSVSGARSFADFFYFKVKIQVTYGDYFLLSDGTWTTIDSKITYYVKSNDIGKWQTLSILAGTPDNAYYLGENINVRMYFPVVNDPDFTSLSALKAVDTNPGGTTIGEGFKTEWYDSVSGYTNFYELRRDTDTADDLNVVRPDDYNAGTNPYQWILQGSFFGGAGGTVKIDIDKIALNILSGGRELPETCSFTTDMEDKNKLILNKIIYHGGLNKTGKTVLNFGLASLPISFPFLGTNAFLVNVFYSQNYYGSVEYTAECADIAYCGYFRDANGDAFTLWTRDNITEERKIEEIFLAMYAAQYNRPWQKIAGSIYSDDTLLTPIDTVKDFTGSSNKKFYPVALKMDLHKNEYDGEFLELKDATDADGANAAAEFNLDFNLDFTS